MHIWSLIDRYGMPDVEAIFNFLSHKESGCFQDVNLKQTVLQSIDYDNINRVVTVKFLNVFDRVLGEMLSVTFYIDDEGNVNV